MGDTNRITTFCTADGYAILARELAEFRMLSYQELTQFVGPSIPRRVTTSDATKYLLEVTARWLNTEGGDIIVDGWIAVDDCGPMRRLDDYFVVNRP
jgi:hypothetical protein